MGGFYDAIERLDKSALPVKWQDFPLGACGDAALLLGTLLEDRDCGPCDYVSGSIGSEPSGAGAPSHAWVEVNGLVVDVTADQFGEELEPVIVVLNSVWHNSLLDIDRRRADFRSYDANTVAVLGGLNNEIVQEMKI